MNKIKVSEFYNYFEEELSTLSTSLYENDEIDTNLKFAIYYDSGTYIDDTTEVRETDNPLIRVLFSDGGGLIEPSIAIDTYVQLLNFEFFAREDQRNDLSYLLAKLALSYKSVLTTVGTVYSTLINIGTLPEISAKFPANGEDMFTAKLSASCVIFDGANISNDWSIYLNDEEIKYGVLAFSANTEMTANLKKEQDKSFVPSTVVREITWNGLYTSSTDGNGVLDSIMDDAINDNEFGAIYTFKLYKGTTLKSEKNVRIKVSKLTFAYNKIASYELIIVKAGSF